MATYKLPAIIGLTNMFATTDIPNGFVRDLVNCDIDSAGRLVLPRPGATQVYSGTGCHSWFEFNDGVGRGLFVEGGLLKRLNADYTALTLASVGDSEMSYVEFNGRVYYSNKVVFGCYRYGVASPVGIPVPGHQPTATATTSGGMYAGTYGVAIRWMRNGEASGTIKSVYVDVPSDGGITLTGFPPPPATVDEIEVFLSRVNGEELYYYDTFPATTDFIALHYSREADPLDTQFLRQSVPGLGLTVHEGRLHWLRDNAVGRSVPFRFGLTEPMSGLSFPNLTTNIISVSGADRRTLYVTTTHAVYRVDNVEGQYRSTKVLPYGVPRGAYAYVADKTLAAIFSERGVVLLSQDGVKEVHAEQFSPPELNRVSAAVVPAEGYDKLVVVGSPTGVPGRLQHSDY